MKIYRVFDEVFRNRSNIAVLRALLDTNSGFSGNEVARNAGIHPRSAFKALTILEELGIVIRQIGGRDHIFSLNREHYLVKESIINVFDTEIKFLDEIINSLKAILKKHVFCAVIYGSTSRKEETSLSDLDICCIVNSKKGINEVRHLLNKKSLSLNKNFGLNLAPVFFSKYEFKQKKNSKLIKDIVGENILITGKNPEVLLNG